MHKQTIRPTEHNEYNSQIPPDYRVSSHLHSMHNFPYLQIQEFDAVVAA